MAPKKKEAAGPSVQDIEDQWKVKQAAWQQEEKHLEECLRVFQDDLKHYQAKIRDYETDVRTLKTTSEQLVSKTSSSRMQFHQKVLQLSAEKEAETRAVEEKDQKIRELNESLQTLRSGLSQLETSRDSVTATHADKMRAVALRRRCIATLREKVVRLRNSKAELGEVLRALNAQSEVVFAPPVGHYSTLFGAAPPPPILRRPNHFIVVSDALLMSFSISEVAAMLTQRYDFGVTMLSPPQPQSLSVCTETNNSAAVSLSHIHIESTLPVSVEGESDLSVLAKIHKARCEYQQFSVNNISSAVPHDIATCFLHDLHHLLWGASRGDLFFENRRICFINAWYCDRDQNHVHLAGSPPQPPECVCFMTQRTTSAEAASSGDESFRVVVAVSDILRIFAYHAVQRDSAVIMEATAFDSATAPRYVFVATPASSADSSGFITVFQADNTQADFSAAPFDSLHSSSIAGLSLLRVLVEHADVSEDRTMSAASFAHRLSMKLLLVPGVHRVATPTWAALAVTPSVPLSDEATAMARSDDGEEGSSCLLPKPRLSEPTQSSEIVVEVKGFSSSLADDDSLSLAPSYLSCANGVVLASSAVQWASDEHGTTEESFFVVEQQGILHPLRFIHEIQKQAIYALRKEIQRHIIATNGDDDISRRLAAVNAPIAAEWIAGGNDRFVIRVFPQPLGGNQSFNDVFRYCIENSLLGVERHAYAKQRARSPFAVDIAAMVAEVGQALSSTPVGDGEVAADAADASNHAATPQPAAQVTPVYLRRHVVCVKATPLKVAEASEISTSKNNDAAAALPGGCQWIPVRMRRMPTFVALSALRLSDTLHLRHLRNTMAEQQLTVVIVSSAASVSVEEQRTEIDNAVQTLLKGHSLPPHVVHSAVWAHVSLADLSCSAEEREAILQSKESASSGDVEQKRLVWRNAMSLFPQRVASFLQHVSYPCVLISSFAVRNDEPVQGLCIPRSGTTRVSVNRPHALFRSDVLCKGMEVFLREILHLSVSKSDTTPAADLSSIRNASYATARVGSTLSTAAAGNEMGSDFDRFRVADRLPPTWIAI